MKTLFSFRDKQLDINLLIHTFFEDTQIRLVLLQAMRSNAAECKTDFGLYVANISHKAMKLAGGIDRARNSFVPSPNIPNVAIHVILTKDKVMHIRIIDDGTIKFDGPLFQYTKGIPQTFRRSSRLPRRTKRTLSLPPDATPHRGFRRALRSLTRYIEHAAEYEGRARNLMERRLLLGGEITRTMLSRLDKQSRPLLDKALDNLVFSKRILIRTLGRKEIYSINPEYIPLAPNPSAR